MRKNIYRWLIVVACIVLMVAAATVSALAADVEYYGREGLSRMENSEALLYAYDQIVQAVDNTESVVTMTDGVHYISSNELKEVVRAVTRDHTEQFWFDTTKSGYSYSYNNQGVTYVKFSYFFTGDALKNAKAQFEQKVNTVLSVVEEGMTDYEKELAIHDKLASMIVYADHTYAHDAYGALVSGAAVCEGYAEALQYVLQRAGIQSYIVTGTGNGGPHAWNLVRLDGNYYYTDLTWDDQDSYTYHAYFNLTTQELQEDHYIEEPPYGLPVCDHHEEHYFTHENTIVENYTVESVAAILTGHHMNTSVFLKSGSVSSFRSWLGSNINSILKATGAMKCCTGIKMGYMGREIVLTFQGVDTTSPAVAPTCTEPGWTEGHHCNVCGTDYGRKQIPALGHNIMEGVDKAPTCTEPGYSASRACITCQMILENGKEIPPTGHKNQTVTGYAATCTETGLSDGVVCADCGVVLKAQETLPALGHDAILAPGYPATCTMSGLTDGSYCTRCNLYIVRPELIPATDHIGSYTDNGDGTHDYVCNSCNTTVSNDVVHNFENGLCVCGAKKPASVWGVKGVSRAKNLSLKDVIYMKATVAFMDSTGTVNSPDLTHEQIMKDGRILFWSGKDLLGGGMLMLETATSVKKLTDAGVYKDGIHEYYAYSHGVTAAEYGDTIYYCTYIEANGRAYYGELCEYSVLTYAENQFKKTTAAAQALKPLLASMLNYGAAAQINFDYRTDYLANRTLKSWVNKGLLDADYVTMSWDDNLLNSLDVVSDAMSRNFVVNNAKRTAASLSLQSMVQPKLTFAYKLSGNMGSKLPAGGSVTFYYWSGADYETLEEEGRPLSKYNATYTLSGNAIAENYSAKYGYEYVAYFQGIPAKALGDAMYVAAVFTMADGTEYCSGVTVYSPEVYAGNQLGKTSTTEKLKNLLKWMVIYGEAASNYYA